MSATQERTEPATPKRRERARAQGDHARSALGSYAAVAWLVAALALGVPCFSKWWAEALRLCLTDGINAATSADFHPDLIAVGRIVRSVMPWNAIGLTWVAALLASVASAAVCGSISWSPGALRWRSSRISPLSGMRALLSRESLTHTGIALSAAVAALSCAVPPAMMLISGSATPLTLGDAAILARDMTIALWWRATLALSIIAVIDIVLARRRLDFRLRMTPREVRDERVEHEGKPEFKARRRSITMRRSRRLHVAALKRAAAVLTNPTHLAVALEYAPPQIDVPVVSAAGAGAAAAILRTAAAFYDVPIVESPELARALFARVEIDDPIPEELYAGIAAVFAWILKTRGRLGPGSLT